MFFFITAKDSYVYFFLLSFISNIAKRFKLISILIIRCFFSSKEKKNQVNIFIALNLPKKNYIQNRHG